MLSKDEIFYNYIKDVVHFYSNPRKHQYDEEVVKLFNTIRYLGGESTANFLRGPACHRQGRRGKVILKAKLKEETFMVHLQLHVQNGRGVTQ